MPYLKSNFDLLLVSIISLFVCVIGSGFYDIYILDEAKNAEAAREMLIDNNYIVPKFNAVLRTDKPVLHYYFMSVSYQLFGINSFSARFFSGIMGALTLVLSFFFIKKYSGITIARIFILISWSSFFFIQEFHLAVPDPYLIFFITAALWFFYDHYMSKYLNSLFLLYISLALGVLVKGPVAIALPGLIILLFLSIKKQINWSYLKTLKLHLGIPLFLAIILPWYVLVHIKTDGLWTEGFLFDHNFNRFGESKEGHGGIFLVTWAFIILGLMPFSFFIPYALIKQYHKRNEPLVLFCGLVFLVFTLFFSISGTKLPNYTMPSYVFVTFLIAKTLHEFYINVTSKKHIRIVVILITLLSFLIPVAGKIALQNEKSLQSVSDLAFLLFIPSLLSAIGCILFFKQRLKASFIITSSSWILTGLLIFTFIYPKLTQQNPVHQTKLLLKKDVKIVAYKSFDPAFPFNLQQIIPVFHSIDAMKSVLAQSKDKKTVIITNSKAFEDLQELGFLELVLEQKAIFENHITRVYRPVSTLLD